jgi:hypothetical protein
LEVLPKAAVVKSRATGFPAIDRGIEDRSGFHEAWRVGERPIHHCSDHG